MIEQASSLQRQASSNKPETMLDLKINSQLNCPSQAVGGGERTSFAFHKHTRVMLCHRKIPNLNISLYSFNLRWKDNRWDIKCSAPIQNSTIWDKRATLDKKKRAESFFLKNQRTSKLQPNNVFAQINQTRTHKSYKRIKQISRLQQTYALRSFQH